MVHLHVAWEPHVGTSIVTRAEGEAARLHRRARQEGRGGPFHRYLADTYAALLAGAGSEVHACALDSRLARPGGAAPSWSCS
jgi:hypothetical protein